MIAVIDPFPGGNNVYCAPGVTPDPAWATERPVCSVCLGSHRRESFYVNEDWEKTGESCLSQPIEQAKAILWGHGLRRAALRQSGPVADKPWAWPRPVEAWVQSLRELPEEAVTDEEAGLCLLQFTGIVFAAQLTLFSSAARLFDRKQERVRRAEDERQNAAEAKARERDNATGDWLGSVGGAQNLGLLTCTDIRSLGSSEEHPEWGERFLIRFTGPGGEHVVWFTGAGGSFDPKPQEQYYVRAGVKEHGVYKGVKQTVIARAKVYDPNEE